MMAGLRGIDVTAERQCRVTWKWNVQSIQVEQDSGEEVNGRKQLEMDGV